ncbi:MAG: LytTR family DNA-binding domain-containing protein [Bacteroidetes bacterium]|jgi:two-component system LytT family response regulator|nr:LytTR family DNA-binding domain-containing protein [Bacteroidota bacterium]MDA0930659.1 LytTR family DNA-binding domain-containing protein [Bacteroidota bacterium]
MNAIIIDDEPLSVALLESYLMQELTDVQVVGSAESLAQAKVLIESYKPDLIFLDVQLGRENGFDLLEAIQPHSFQVIFVTAYAEFAVRAFRFSVADYLLKPIVKEELVEAVKRAQRGKELASHGRVRTLRIPGSRGAVFVPTREVVRLIAKGAYTEITLTQNRVHLCSGNLSFFEEHLTDRFFLRVGRSCILNLHFLMKVEAQTKAAIEMRDGYTIPIPRRQKKLIIERLNAINTQT